jgi:glutaminase
MHPWRKCARAAGAAAVLIAMGCVAGPQGQEARGEPAPGQRIQSVVDEAHAKFKDDRSGKNADYIPALAKVPSELYGVVVVTTDGKVYTAGDVDHRFSIQSCSKVFTLCQALQEWGAEEVSKKIGVEPSGLPFNSTTALGLHGDKALNPLVNAGAIATVSLIKAGSAEERWRKILDYHGRFAGEKLSLIDEVYTSEAATNYRNRGFAHILFNNNALYCDPLEATDVYTKQCSIGVSAKQLCVMGATLANGGVNPVTKERVLDAKYVPKALAVMMMAGFYDESGQWAYRTGLPAKTGVGGGIVTVVPGKMAIVGFSPRVIEAGNSVRATKGTEHIVRELGLNLFAPAERGGRPTGHAAPRTFDQAVALMAAQDPPAKPGQEDKAPPSPIPDRQNLRDEQQPAPRPGNLTLDPKYQGFWQIPSTPVLMKINAKPRADLTLDNRNTGDENRFVTARIPVEEDPGYGGGRRFNINAKGSQLSLDARAPDVAGSPRFFFQNDFYGSGPGEFPIRVRHLYGQIYNLIVGQTFSVFEDPDAWPDTVDYEGPNSVIFARRPLARYMWALNKHLQMNFGVEQPESEVDTTIDPDAEPVNRSPDVGLNLRWEPEDIGHIQIAGIFREIGVDSPLFGRDTVFGWGVNFAGNLNVWGRDSIQVQVTYGEGIFRYFNDDFVNNDAAIDEDGDLEAIPAVGYMLGLTHHWLEDWRSTATFGYVRLDPEATQGPDAYYRTLYASLNLVWQIRKRLSVGVEGLWGEKEDNAGRDGDAFRGTIGLVYSLFD